MSSQLPDKKGIKNKDPFGELVRSMNDFLNEKPVRGFLESIDEFFKNPFPNLPFHIDIKETVNEYIVTAELPGIRKEQINIDTVGNQLTISITNDEEILKSDENQQVNYRRKSLQRSSRSVSLPHPINEKQVRASYKDGLLQIKIPIKMGKSIRID